MFEKLISCYVFPYSPGLHCLPVSRWESELSFASEIIKKTLFDFGEQQTDPTVTVLVDQNSFSYSSCPFGAKFSHRKALTGAQAAEPERLQQLQEGFPLLLLLNQVLNPLHNGNAIWDDPVISECRPGEVQQLLHKAKTTERLWRSGHLRIIISTSFPNCQDTRPFICSAATAWAVLAEHITDKVLYWTMQVPENSTCKLVELGL